MYINGVTLNKLSWDTFNLSRLTEFPPPPEVGGVLNYTIYKFPQAHPRLLSKRIWEMDNAFT